MPERLERTALHISEFADLLVQRRHSGRGKIVVFAGAGVSTHPPSGLPNANELKKATIDLLLKESDLEQILPDAELRTRATQHIRRRALTEGLATHIPLEMIYDAIHEVAGEKVYHALGCLRSRLPNENHRVLASWLEGGYVDFIITTNFDCLLELSLKRRFSLLPSPFLKRIWKIHGSIDCPRTIVATLNRLGKSSFDRSLLDKLQSTLEDSVVLFIGYGGADPDLIPAIISSRMRSVFWCVFKPEAIDKNLERMPWKRFSETGVGVKWLVGDLREEVLLPIHAELQKKATHGAIQITNAPVESLPRSLKKSLDEWETDRWKRLSAEEKTRALLQLLYTVVKFQPDNPSDETLELMVQVAEEFLQHRSSEPRDEGVRDVRALLAEGELLLGHVVKAKDWLTDVLPIPIRDAAQARILMNAGVILLSLAEARGASGRNRNLDGAERCFLDAIAAARKARLAPERRAALKAQCYANLAFLYLEYDREEEGLTRFQAAEELFPKAGDYHGYTGLCINMLKHCLDSTPRKLSMAKTYYLKARHTLDSFPDAGFEGELVDLNTLLNKEGNLI